MADTGLILCDTDVIIEFYKGNSVISNELRIIGLDRMALSVISAAELIYGALNKKELKRICNDIDSLNLLQINQSINTKFIELMKLYSLSHKLKIPDCLIAATAIEYNIQLFTLNKKDFNFINSLELY